MDHHTPIPPDPRPPERRRRARSLVGSITLCALFSLGFGAPADAASTATVSGVVRVDGTDAPIANAHVTLRESGLSAITNASGAYSITNVPFASNYTVDVDPPCRTGLITSTGPVSANTTVDLEARYPNLVDTLDHVCRVSSFALIGDSDTLSLSGDDASVEVALPFGFPFYGGTKTSMKVSTNGYLTFGADDGRANANQQVPGSLAPNDSIFAFWDDLVVGAGSSVVTGSTGVAPNRVFMVEWRDVTFFGDTTGARITVQAQLFEDGNIALAWRGIGPTGREQGSSASIGIRSGGGAFDPIALQQSFNRSTLVDGLKVTYPSVARPVAKAGPDQAVASGSPITLNGATSTGSPPLRFAWFQVGAKTTTIIDPNKAKATVANQTGPRSLEYEVLVTDQFGRSDSDVVRVEVLAPKPK